MLQPYRHKHHPPGRKKKTSKFKSSVYVLPQAKDFIPKGSASNLKYSEANITFLYHHSAVSPLKFCTKLASSNKWAEDLLQG